MLMTIGPRALVLCLAAAAAVSPVRAEDAPEATHPFEHVVQFRDRVVVSAAGNGGLAATFPTTVEGEAVRYVLVVENGCEPGAPAGTCPPPVESIRVTLNGDVVFQTAAAFSLERLPVPLNDVGGEANQIAVTAGGQPGSAARVTIVALRPLPIVVGGRSVLPLASTLSFMADILFVHNAGPSDLVYRVELFHADGSTAGVTPPRLLAAHGTATVDINSTAAALNPAWVRGPVHVRWAARGFTRVSTTVREFRRAPDASGNLVIVGAYELALDDYRPVPLRPAEAAFFGF
jgi:hypothetical protein